ncbi:hypothetical protein AK830_g5408 [Neonectria ditissima]|uniref:Phosphoglycerate mutase-like protein n=1 Tax=Neonectria ditissima TaxID=78410 RepID=A0A0P7B523_9HYPO|nr:hypothetical protein AK830_g5408 [Neonectria ditissima]
MPVTIHLVRHAQGIHNLCQENESIPDPALTELGEQQCRELRAQFPHHDKVTRLFASPLRRTLNTCLLSFGRLETADTAQNPHGPVVAIPELQEVSDSPCDTGSDAAILRREFAGLVDLQRVYDGWNAVPEWVSWQAKIAELQARALRARLVLREMLQFAGEDEHVVVVTHGAFLHFFTGDYYGIVPPRATAWNNTEVRSFQFLDPEGCDPEALLVETAPSWEIRYGDMPRPTLADQQMLQQAYYEQVQQWLDPAMLK